MTASKQSHDGTAKQSPDGTPFIRFLFLLRIEILIFSSGRVEWQLLLFFGIIITMHGNRNARTSVVIMR